MNTLKVIDSKTGKVIHTLRGLSNKEIEKRRRDFYRILVFKMKQKIEFRVDAA